MNEMIPQTDDVKKAAEQQEGKKKNGKKFHFPRCPHCGKRAGPFRTWILRREGEYICPACGGISNVTLSSMIYLLAGIAVFLSALVFILNQAVFHGGLTVLFFILLVLPFVLFYIASEFLVRLKKPVFVKKKISQKGVRRGVEPVGRAGAPRRPASHTIKMDPIRKGK